MELTCPAHEKSRLSAGLENDVATLAHLLGGAKRKSPPWNLGTLKRNQIYLSSKKLRPCRLRNAGIPSEDTRALLAMCYRASKVAVKCRIIGASYLIFKPL
jgi:hypothetical protein